MHRWRVFRFLESYNYGKRVRDGKDFVRLNNSINSQVAKYLLKMFEEEKIVDPEIKEIIKNIKDKYPEKKTNKSIIKSEKNKELEEQKRKQIIEIIEEIVRKYIVYEIFYPSKL